MSRGYKTGFIIFLLLLALLTYLEASEQEPVNWSPSYTAKDKIPLGGFVLFENLKEESFNLKSTDLPPYDFLNDNAENGIYFFLNDRLFFDDDELDKLFSWVENGNTAFLSAENFSNNLLDSLGLEIGISIPEKGISSKPEINLVHPELENPRPFSLDREFYNYIFTGIDTLKHTVLGNSRLSSDTVKTKSRDINFLRVPFGDGEFLLHTMPVAFSNYFLLKEQNYRYAQNALAYLPAGENLFWDQYYKSGKIFYTSPLYILLNNRSLKWTYYLVIIGSILFVLFEGKRKQRSIPEIPPLKNQSIHFARTIAGLHLERNDHEKIVTKKINLFLEYIRKEYKLPTGVRDKAFLERLAAHSDHPLRDVIELFVLINMLEKKQEVTWEELLKLNSAINAFKNRTDGKQRNKK